MATVSISFGALLVSLLSFSIASERLRLDLYNKRFDIYVRTVKLYQALMKSKEDEIPDSLLADFILASRLTHPLIQAKPKVCVKTLF